MVDGKRAGARSRTGDRGVPTFAEKLRRGKRVSVRVRGESLVRTHGRTRTHTRTPVSLGRRADPSPGPAGPDRPLPGGRGERRGFDGVVDGDDWDFSANCPKIAVSAAK